MTNPITDLLLSTARHDPATLAAMGDGPSRLVVVDDPDGSLALAATQWGVPVHVRCASRAAALAVRAAVAGTDIPVTGEWPDPAEHGEGSASGPTLVLAHLPKSLRGVESLAHAAADLGQQTPKTSAPQDVVLVGGARLKYMTPTMNEVLMQRFEHVHATRAQRKSRCLVASGPRPHVDRTPIQNPVHAEGVDLTLCAVGDVFNGAEADHGSLLLLDALADHGPDTPQLIHDLGCGNGLLTAWLAHRFPEAHIVASDDSRDAVASTRATLTASFTGTHEDRVQVTWQDRASDEPPASTDLVVLNPPFHRGGAIDTDLSTKLIDAGVRLLRPGGQLWVVYNSHLRHRRHLEQYGRVEQMARDPRFTVVRMTYDRWS